MMCRKVYRTLKEKGVFEVKAPTEDLTNDAGNVDDTMVSARLRVH